MLELKIKIDDEGDKIHQELSLVGEASEAELMFMIAVLEKIKFIMLEDATHRGTKIQVEKIDERVVN